jgi:Secretion system C-terminal sorting domain
MQHLQISIPKPCHQDWNKMTPEERGRFCSVCQKTVLDFSEKTKEEIQEFILAHRHEKLCGRFRSEHLAEFSRIELPMPVYQSRLSFLNSFVAALLFCFGTSLFSCNLPASPTLGKVEARYAQTPPENSPDTNKVMVVGDIDATPAQCVSTEITHLKGEVEFVDEPDTTINLSAVEITDSLPWWEKGGVQITVGALMVKEEVDYPPMYDEEDTMSAEKDNVLLADGNFFTSVYPNPSGGLINIKIQLAEEEWVQMDLYDLNGRLIRNLLSEIQPPELRTMQVDMTDQPPGIYFVKIIAGDMEKTERVIIAGK